MILASLDNRYFTDPNNLEKEI